MLHSVLLEIFTANYPVGQEIFNPLRTYVSPVYHIKTLHSTLRVYLCVPHGSYKKQRLFP
jgi:hypothetical protein